MLLRARRLTKLDLSECELMSRIRQRARAVRPARVPARPHAQLIIKGWVPNGARDILAAPTLRSLTRLCLVNVGITVGPWPWQAGVRADSAARAAAGRQRTSADAGAAAFAADVAALAQLRRLDISECGLTVASALAHALWRLPRLQELAREFW